MHPAASERNEIRSAPYELFALGLSVFALALLVLQALVPEGGESAILLQYIDTGVCALFLADFVRNVATAADRGRYLYTWGWIDLLSSIPFWGVARLGRAARIIRILRVLRGFRSVRHLLAHLLQRRAQTAFATAALVAVVILAFSSVAVLQFEAAAEGGNIRNAQDALWWAWATITTVGYGDRFPVTAEGRIVAALLMTVGVGLFASLAGMVASWLTPTAPGANASKVESDYVTPL